jgi:hypothetical protein
MSLGCISQLQFLRSSMPVRYSIGTQTLKLRIRNFALLEFIVISVKTAYTTRDTRTTKAASS